jgi:hypothetical protein
VLLVALVCSDFAKRVAGSIPVISGSFLWV